MFTTLSCVWSVGATLPVYDSRGVAAFILVELSFQSIFIVIFKVVSPQILLFHKKGLLVPGSSGTPFL